ncbi:signal transducer and activator of transcription 2 [Gastrophryne carolinensis]
MSQWEALLRLSGHFKEQVQCLYSLELLPMVIRQYLAAWIESQDWRLAARDLSLARIQFHNFLENLDMQIGRFISSQEILYQHNFRKFKFNIQQLYQEEPQKLAELVRDILHQERQILDAQEMELQIEQKVEVPPEFPQHLEIEQRVTKVKERLHYVDQEVKFLEEQQEIFDFKYKNFQMISASNPAAKHLQSRRQELQNSLNELDRKRKEVLDQIKELLGLCETLLEFLQLELNDWVQKQKLACIGAGTVTCLKNLEGWITRTVEVFFHLKRLLCLLEELALLVSYERDPLKTQPQTLKLKLEEMLKSLLQCSFVVDKQPIMTFPCKRAQVLKTSTQFSVRVRLLVNLPEIRNVMKVSYTIDKYRRFNLLGSETKTLDKVQGNGLVAEYKHLTLKEQKAGPGGKGSKGANDGSLSVIEELHNITFTTQFNHEGIVLDLEAVTLPFVVISNLSQFTGAWASVLWFNMLSSDPKDVTFFSKPPAAPWTLLANGLSWQFSCCTQRGLNTEQLQMLGKKLCGTTPTEKCTVSWGKFAKETMPNLSFTFWVWFDNIVTLVKGHLEDIWNDGLVMGFVSRSMEDTLLKSMQQGTFLLRFSESLKDGGVTCSWVDHQPDGHYFVHSVEPYTKKELSHIPLTEIIRNYQLLAEENIPENPLRYLYPNIPKDDAFGKYYEQRSDVTLEYQKYMQRRLIIVSKRNVDDPDISVTSGTPQYDPESTEIPLEQLRLMHGEPGDNPLLDPESDPMFSSLMNEAQDFSLDYCNAYQ